MSIALAMRVPEGIVLATDSRLTLAREKEGKLPDLCFLDESQKLWPVGAVNPTAAVALAGTAGAFVRTVGDLIREYSRKQESRKTIAEIATDLQDVVGKAGLERTTLLLAGFDESSYFGRIFEVQIPGAIIELHPNSETGVTVKAQRAVAQGLIEMLQPPINYFGLASARRFAEWLVVTSRDAQGFSLGSHAIGGVPRIAVLERGLRPVIE